MSTLGDQLRHGDPLTHEPAPAATARARARDRALDAVTTSASSDASRRRLLRSALAGAGVIVAAGIGGRALWPAVGTPAFAAVRFEVRLAENQPAAGLRDVPVGLQARIVYLHDDVVLTNADVAGARIVAGALPDSFGVAVRLTPEGGERMRAATRQHLERPVALMLDGVVVAAPTVRSEIGEVGVLSGDFTRAEAERIVRGILPQ